MKTTRYIALFSLAGLITAAALAAPASAAKAKTCTASSPNVIGHKITGELTSKDVYQGQRRFATCKHAKKVMKRATELRVEEPRSIRAFYCLPTVLKTAPDLVKYNCTFKGADTATFVKLTFKVKYNLD